MEKSFKVLMLVLIHYELIRKAILKINLRSYFFDYFVFRDVFLKNTINFNDQNISSKLMKILHPLNIN